MIAWKEYVIEYLYNSLNGIVKNFEENCLYYEVFDISFTVILKGKESKKMKKTSFGAEDIRRWLKTNVLIE